MNSKNRPWQNVIGAMVLAPWMLLTSILPAHATEAYVDSHFHIANYAMQGIPLKTLIDQYMGDKIARSVVFALPLQQKWDRFEHFAEDKIAPNYYMGPKAGMYYYSFVDAMVAMDYLKLSAADQARLDPMIVGFNPMDEYGVNHVKRLLILFPGVFTGIGEFSVHKEIVSDKISDDLTKTNIPAGEALPPDATDFSKNSLYNPSLKTLFDFAAEAGLIVSLHSDIYPARVTHDGKLISLSPETPYSEGMKHPCRSTPNTTVYWAHTGLGRFVKPAPNHLQLVAELLDSCPNWHVDLSWDLVQNYIVAPQPDMPSFADWVRFVDTYQDRILWGSDTVIYTRNKTDSAGKPFTGSEMPVADYLAVTGILTPLWEVLGPEVAHKVKVANHVRLFDSAKAKVRAWEAAHSKDNIWNLPAQ